MQLTANAAQGDFEIHPAGAFPAFVQDITELGSQEVGGMYPGIRRLVRIAFQTNELMDDGRPMRVYARYTLSFHEKAKLRQMLEGWRGKKFADGEAFELRDILGKPCMVNITHSDDGKWANVSSVAPMPKGMPALLYDESELLYFGFDDPNYLDTYQKLSPRMQEMIAQSPEFKGEDAKQAENQQTQQQREPTKPMTADFDDALPF